MIFLNHKAKRICAIQLKLKWKSEVIFQNLDYIKFKNLLIQLIRIVAEDEFYKFRSRFTKKKKLFVNKK